MKDLGPVRSLDGGGSHERPASCLSWMLGEGCLGVPLVQRQDGPSVLHAYRSRFVTRPAG